MAVALNNNHGADDGNGTTVSFSYTSGSGSDRLLLTAGWASQSISSASYAGAALTSIGGSGTFQIFSKTGPATGANTLSFTLSTYGRLADSTSDWTGVDGATPTGTLVSNSGSSAAPDTGSVTVPSNGAAWGAFRHAYATAPATATAGTLINSAVRGGGTAVGSSYRATTGTLTWSVNHSASWLTLAVPINPVSAGDTSIAGAPGTAAASGFTGNVNANRTLSGALGTATASGFKGNVNANRTIAGSLGIAAATGFQGTVTNGSGTSISGNLGVAVASGLAGGVAFNRFIAGVLGTAAASGFTGAVSNGSTTDLALILKILRNRQELNASTGTFTLYDDDGTTVLYQSNAWADAAGTIPYSGGTLARIDALV